MEEEKGTDRDRLFYLERKKGYDLFSTLIFCVDVEYILVKGTHF